MSEQSLVILLFVIGVIARAVVPYVTEWLKTNAPFDWKYLVGQLLGAAVAIIPLLGNSEWVDTLMGSRPEAAVAIGWIAADIGREAQKVYDVVKMRLS